MYKQKLRELLKEVPEIKKDLEELRFGTKIQYKNTSYSLGVNKRWYLSYTETATVTWEYGYFENKKYVNIIGNPLSEHHLRRYLNKLATCQCGVLLKTENIVNGICDGCTGNNALDDCSCGNYFECKCDDCPSLTFNDIFEIEDTYYNIIKLLELKDFDNQSEEVYEKIFNYLTK